MAEPQGRKAQRKPSSKVRRIQRQMQWEKEKEQMNDLEELCKNIDTSLITKFCDFPISRRTLQGLSKAGYTTPTEIQKEAIAVSLRGDDVLGAAKTGSGKTLAFLIPIMEVLWRQKWSAIDGLGALIISPTRELAYQTFEVLCKVGSKHDLSAGLIIGGKDLKEEQERIRRTNIIVCTPGRLLQHMDETPDFDAGNVQVLVLDEADRILDMGFAPTLNAIVENLPSERQSLLFSATQTRSVQDLARLSLQDPTYVSVHEHSKTSTPKGLTQSYVVCELQDKLNFLFSFIRNHIKSKILVFMSSCKQVKFVFEVLRRLRPGIPLMALYGKQKQLKRVAIYNDFCKKTQAVLLATDIAARGLDFPAVNWVVQMDCPEDANTYIHRAGRTARYHKDGQSLLMLLPSEEPEMFKALEEKKIPISKIRVNPAKLTSIQKKLEAFCAQDQDIKHWAQKNVVSYVRSVFLQSNKKIFDVSKLPLQEYATSLGLLNPPKIRFLKKAEKQLGRRDKSSNEEDLDWPKKSGAVLSSRSSSEGEESENEREVGTRNVAFKFDEDTDTADDLLVLKKRNVKVDAASDVKESLDKARKIKTKASSAKKLVNKKIKVNTKIRFGQDGEPLPSGGPPRSDPETSSQQRLELVPLGEEAKQGVGGISVEESRNRLRVQDTVDRQKERERVRTKHKDRKMKSKQRRKQGQSIATLEPGDEENSSSEEEIHRPKKSRSLRESDEEIEVEAGTSLQEDEELALQLLTHTSKRGLVA